MSTSATDKLSGEKIQQLLDAVGAKSGEDQSRNLETTDFDWRQARYFNLEQFDKAKEFAEIVVTQCIEDFSCLYQDESKVSVISTKERFSQELDGESKDQAYYIPFGPDSNQLIGLLNVPKSTALLWTGLILGATDSKDDTDRELSKLEETFLLDIASGLINRLAEVYGSNLQADRLVIPEESSFILSGSEELLEITFESARAESGEASAQASFLLCCDKLETITGKASSSQAPKLSEEQIRNVIMEHVHHVPLSVHVRLGTTRLAFKDIMDLQVNDIVVLNKDISEPVELLVEGRTLLHGYPAQSDGKYAVVIA